MKNRFFLIVPLLIIFSLCSCASNPTAKNSTETGSKDVHKEKKQNPKKLLFDDWKYKGFGQDLPVWFEAAYENNVEKIKKSVAQLSQSEVVIIRGEGINSDQAERVMELQKAAVPEGFEFYDSFWAMTGEGKYISLALYKE